MAETNGSDRQNNSGRQSGSDGPETGASRSEAARAAPCPHPIQQALAAHTTITLAYVDDDGPQACAVLYATDATDVTDATSATTAAKVGEAAREGAGGTGVAAGAAGGPVLHPVLYFVTSTTTRHGRALAGPGARVAFTAQRDGQEWSGLTGIQGRGRCRPLSGAERAVGWRVYTRCFPFVEADERLRAALERTTLWELRPDWLRLIDNGQGFGHKVEWQRPEGS